MSKFTKPSNKSLFHDDFDATYKASPNFVDRNEIYRCIEEGLSPEETALKVHVRVASVKRYFEEYEKRNKKPAGKK